MGREENLQQTQCVISHQTLNMLPHYLWKFESSNLAQICRKCKQKMSHKPAKFP